MTAQPHHEELLAEIGEIEKEKFRLEQKKDDLIAKIKENSGRNSQYFNKLLGEILSVARDDCDYTLDDAIGLSGVTMSRSSLSSIEHGQQQASFHDVYLLSKLYDIKIEDVVERIKEKMSQV